MVYTIPAWCDMRVIRPQRFLGASGYAIELPGAICQNQRPQLLNGKDPSRVAPHTPVKHAMAVGTNDCKILHSGRLALSQGGEWDAVMALREGAAQLTVHRLEVEIATFA